MRIVAIDPGVEGAIALIRGDRKDVEVWDIGCSNIGGSNQMNARPIVDFLAGWGEIDAVILEDNRTNGNNGAKANFSMGLSMGTVLGIVTAMERPLVRVKPREWQQALGLGSIPRADRKNAHRQRASEIFPEMADSLKRVKDHNRADALLMAEWGKRSL